MKEIRRRSTVVKIGNRKAGFSREGETYGLIVAVNGYHHIDGCLRVLKPDGRLSAQKDPSGSSSRRLHGRK
jgi:hypothetical protein